MKIARIIFTVLLVLLIIFLIDNVPSNEKSESANDMKEENGMDESSIPAKAAANTGSLEKQLDSYLESEPNLEGAIIGISIRSAATGDLLYQHNADTRLHPASNMKLFTAASALSTLGADHTFTTEVLRGGQVNGGTLYGDLYLKGKGDPTLLPEDFADFAKTISESGINKISGNIIADDTWYDNIRVSPDLIWDDEQFYYGAQISALTVSPDKDYNAGSVNVSVTPGKPGEKPEITVSPKTDYVDIVNTAKTIASGEEEDIEVGREHGTNVITIDGTIPADTKPLEESMAVWEPTDYALNLFKKALVNQGISWTGDIKTGKTPDDAEILLSHESMPLSELLLPFMKLSNNVHAETLVKEMGKVVKGEGSFEKGLEVIEEQLLNFGLNIETLKLRDGSGISSSNLIPPNEISKLLYAIQKEKWYTTYIHSLPVAGAEERLVGGTLQDRMEDIADHARVQAKTGTIQSVSSLSGYLNTRESETVIFSIVINHLLDEDDGKGIEDKIVSILANE
nr:D-alanyl-D-alanine carboxypeptidase/D-alanyl-D-alanine-endopeptidase [Virgibacillus phasianinus]